MVKYGGKRRVARRKPRRVGYQALGAPDRPFRGVNYGQELSTWPIAAAAQAQVSNAMQYSTIFLPVQAISYAARVGIRTVTESILAQFTVRPGLTQVSTEDVRCFLLWDQQPNGALPGSPLPLIDPNPYSTRDPQYTSRFTILKECVVTTGPGQNGAGNNTELVAGGFQRAKPYKWYVKKKLQTKWKGNAGTIVDVESGALLFAYIGENTRAAGLMPVITLGTEIKYVM